MITDYLVYNLRLNYAAHFPVANTLIGVTRVVVHTTSLSRHVLAIGVLFFQMQYNTDCYIPNSIELHSIKAYVDLRAIIRGIIEIPPILGGLGSWYWDLTFLTPAQNLAYRIQEIYHTNLTHLNTIEPDSSLIDFNPRDSRNQEFIDFVNNEPIKISNNQNKIEEFCKSFENAEITNEIFNDRKLPFYALAAFEKSRIDRSDMATIMEIYVAKQCFPDCQLERLFDDNRVITENAMKYLGFLDHTADNLTRTKTRGLKEHFLGEARGLPKRKQIFWHHKAFLKWNDMQEIRTKSPLTFGELIYSPVGSLYASLAHIGGLKIVEDQEISLSFTAETLLLNTKYNKKNNPLQPKLGLFKALDIKNEFMENDRRPCATFFPGTRQKKSIHNSLELPTAIVSHDKVHGHILQWYPDMTSTDIKRIITVFQRDTGFEMSKEIWELVEMTLPGLFEINFPLGDSILYNFIHHTFNKLDELQMRELFFQRQEGGEEEPTPLGWIMLLDIYEQTNTYLSKSSMIYFQELRPYKLIQTCQCDNQFKGKSIKQKIWELQQLHRDPKGPIDQALDHQLEFRRVREGRRKNTVILARKAPL